MVQKTYAGITVEVNEEGYFTNPSQWTKEIAVEIAKEEGFREIASSFKMIAKVETEHERRYLKLLQNISQDKVFVKGGKVWWKGMNCDMSINPKKHLKSVRFVSIQDHLWK